MKENKRSLIVVILLVMMVVGVGTFAWLSYRTNDTALVLTVGEIDSLKVTLKPYQINSPMTLTDSYEDEGVVYTNVQANNNASKKAKMKLFYSINSIDSKLITEDFKYTITKSTDGGNTYSLLYEGDFSEINDDNTVVILEEDVPGNSTYIYRVYAWLKNEDKDQSELQGTMFDAELRAEILGVSKIEAPALDDGLIPVILSDDATNGYKVTTTTANDPNWYNYEEQVWANAVLVKEEGTKTREENKVAGTEIDTNDILAYYVWIPRYAYKIWTTGLSTTGSEIPITIEWESANDDYRSGTQVDEYRTHPAFWWDKNGNDAVDSEETLNGIWVGKFETTGNATTPTVLPNMSPIKDQNISGQFQTSLKFAGGILSDGAILFNDDNSYGLSSDINSHMMKNSEFGAIAYLTHSQYGRCQGDNCEQIRINNYYDTAPMTGCGAVDASAEKSNVCSNAYSSGITEYPQSTTGNITGIFDMVGGTQEQVMAVYANSNGEIYSGESITDNSGFNGLIGNANYTDGIPFPTEKKYYDMYTSTNILKACNGGICYGHALSETEVWYNGMNFGIDDFWPWLTRSEYSGGNHDAESNGVDISLYSYWGESGTGVGVFRSILVDESVEEDGLIVKLSSQGDISYTTEKSVKVNIKATNGLASGASVKYGWSTSNSVLPQTFADATLDYSEGDTSVSFNAVGSELTGDYYLWVVPVQLTDVNETSLSDDIISNSTFKFDNTPPDITNMDMEFVFDDWTVYVEDTWTKKNVYAVPSTGQNDDSLKTPWGATDEGSGQVNYQISTDNETWVDYEYTNSGIYLMDSDGINKRYFRACDAIGNCSDYIVKFAKIDKTSPIGEVSTIINDSMVTATLSVNDNGSGLVDTYGWAFTTSSTCDSTVSFTDTNTLTYNFNLTSEGVHYVCARVQDAVGNVSYISSVAAGSYNTYDLSSSYETYVIPETGYYQLEVWGAQGGKANTILGGYGGYSTGTIQLTKGEKLYVYVGGKGKNGVNASNTSTAGGYNGGGQGYVGSTAYYVGGGGGATDIRYFGSTNPSTSDLVWNSELGLNSRIIVAGGGGGVSYLSSTAKTTAIGHGGGYVGVNAAGVTNGGTATAASGGTQTGVGEKGSKLGSFGDGADAGTSSSVAGGGGGWYGGNSHSYAGAGGSGYIGSSLLTAKYMYCYNCDTSSAVDTLTYSTTDDVSSTPIANYVKSGDGAAKITFLGTESSKIMVIGTADLKLEVTVFNIDNIASYCINQNSSDTSDCTWVSNTSTNFVTTSTYVNGQTYYVHIKDGDGNIYHSNSILLSVDFSESLFNYDGGNYTFIDEGNGNWNISFLGSGTLTLDADIEIDVFLVGGGGNGGTYDYKVDSAYGTGTNYYGGGGGGSAYTATYNGLSVSMGTYEITVASAQGTTKAFNKSAAGGKAGTHASGTGTYVEKGIGGVGKRKGGEGVSGGAYSSSQGWYSYTAGSGSNGEYAFGESTFRHAKGAGYKFAASGGGGAGTDGTTMKGVAGKGGTSGGGAGGAYQKNGTNAASNSGSGGGGAGGNGGSYGKGGSGIVIIRNAR